MIPSDAAIARLTDSRSPSTSFSRRGIKFRVNTRPEIFAASGSVDSLPVKSPSSSHIWYSDLPATAFTSMPSIISFILFSFLVRTDPTTNKKGRPRVSAVVDHYRWCVETSAHIADLYLASLVYFTTFTPPSQYFVVRFYQQILHARVVKGTQKAPQIFAVPLFYFLFALIFASFPR